MSPKKSYSLWITILNIAIPINAVLSVKKINEMARLATASEIWWQVSPTAAYIEILTTHSCVSPLKRIYFNLF